ncbi:Tectonin beta-propeller, partial [Halocaridina rubra]
SRARERKESSIQKPTIKRFTVGSIHQSRITSLAWSRNGMRLFCGDGEGVVSEIEINYETSVCQAKQLLKENNAIVQLSYSYMLLAVSTLERTLIFSLSDGSVHQVGKKPRKHTGTFGCIWLPSSTQSDSFLYTSRPGLRLWSANAKGEVLQTHIIKELADSAQIDLFSASPEKPRKGDKFSFGFLFTAGAYIITYTSHWLFIVDLQNLRVCNFSGQFGRILSVAVSGEDIFVLSGVRHVTCLSVKPPDIGERKPVSLVSGIFLEAENLKELKSRIVSQGSDILGQIARMSSTVAAKVSDHAKPNVVTGQSLKGTSDQKSVNNTDCNLFVYQSSQTPLSSTKTSDGKACGHQRSSSCGTVSVSYNEKSSNMIPPNVIHSVSNYFPAMLSTPSLARSHGKTNEI